MKKICAKCKNDPATWNDPIEATGLFVGTWYNDSEDRVMPIRAWLCDMHSEQAESGRFIKDNKG